MSQAARRQDQVGEQAKGLFKIFLDRFTSRDENDVNSTSEQQLEGDYVQQAVLMKQNDLTTMYIDYAHLEQYDGDLASIIQTEYCRLEPFLCSAISTFMKERHPEHAENKAGDKAFFVAIMNMPQMEGIRDLKCSRIGQLMSIQGTVTRTTQVRPELLNGNFRCVACQETPNQNIKQQFKYTEPEICLNPNCDNRDQWVLDTGKSTFVDWQMVRIQEHAQDIPAGSMPRSMKVILRNEIVETAKPGDECVFTGSLIVVPDVSALSGRSVKGVRGGGRRANQQDYQGVSGLKALGVRDLTYRLCFLASSVRAKHAAVGAMNAREEAEDGDVNEDFTVEERKQIANMRQMPRLYSRLVTSIAPTIFGHEEIKRGVLLMLMGGTHKKTKDGASLRGDMNVCIVGDPSTSKSQFLKYVCSFLPRTVYTSGKASSAAGLTASVVRDQETGEFTIEAGALMLADNGICCIDEFDKMDPKDQVAIHEAMEQQTISIAKAGIKATLNARTSILAAANPIHGRYDRSKTLKQNVDISAPIMSRFDLFFVVLDECDEIVDYNIATHICNIHKSKLAGLAVQPDFTTDELQTYIRFARTMKPKITRESRDLLMESYVTLREKDAPGAQKSSYRMTVRQLESMIRLSEARARLDLSEEVLPAHVKEASRLLQQSIVHVEAKDVSLTDYDAEEEGDKKNDKDDDEGNDGGSGDGSDDDNDDDNNDSGKKQMEDEPEDITLTYQEYTRITGMLVLYMRKEEEKNAREGQPVGLQRQTLVDWYARQQDEKFESDATKLKQNTRLIKCIIGRLVETDNVLLVVGNNFASRDEQLLMVHPNYNTEADLETQTLEDDLGTEDIDTQTELSSEIDAIDDTSSQAESLLSSLGGMASSQPDEEKAAGTPRRKTPKRKATSSPASSETRKSPRRSARKTPKK